MHEKVIIEEEEKSLPAAAISTKDNAAAGKYSQKVGSVVAVAGSETYSKNKSIESRGCLAGGSIQL